MIFKRVETLLKKPSTLGLLIGSFSSGLFNWVWFNKYYVVAENWFSPYAIHWIQGFVPYKDTALFLPPLYVWQVKLFIQLFGPNLINLRLLGVGLFVLVGASTYSLLRRMTNPVAACLSTIASIVYLESVNVYIPYDYHSFVTLYALLSVYFLIRAYENLSAGTISFTPREGGFLFSAGLFASSSLLIKHSLGLLIILMDVTLVVLAYMRADKKRAGLATAAFLSGLTLPISLFVLWLVTQSSPRGFYQSVILGIGAKGSLGSILLGFYKLQFTCHFFYLLAVAFSASLGIYLLSRKVRDPFKDTFRIPDHFQLAIWLAVFLGITFIIMHPFGSDPVSARLDKLAVPFALLMTFFMLIRGGWSFYKTADARSYSQLALAFISLCLMYSTAMSTLICQVGAFIGFGIALSLAFECLQNSPWMVMAFSLLVLKFTDTMVAAKYANPYYWWHLDTPGIYDASLVKFDDGLLRGLYTMPATKAAVQGTVLDIQNATTPGDFIFTFPAIPIFYALADRWPLTGSLVHWYDVASDELCRSDLAKLKSHLPKVIVLLDLPDDVLRIHEHVFRKNKASGQREILQWIHQVTDSHLKQYTLKEQFDLGSHVFLKVWDLKDVNR